VDGLQRKLIFSGDRGEGNTVSQTPYFDKKEQLDKIQSGLLPGEQVWAVFDMKGGGTGFVGVTSKRVIVYDKSFLRNMKAIVSIPFSRIHVIAAEDEVGPLGGRGFFSSSKLVLTTSHGNHELEFRGADKAHHAHHLILSQLV
jgi:hypothetical protein